MTWDDECAVRKTDDSTFEVSLHESWRSLQGIHGGIVAGMSVRAAAEAAGESPDGRPLTLRAATFGYAAGNQVGDARIKVDVVRRGRNMTTVHTSMSQEDRTTLVSRMHFSTPWDGVEFSDAPSPPPRPEGTVRLDTPEKTTHISKVETWAHPDHLFLSGGPRAEWKVWSRPKQGDSFDASWLAMYGDLMPPPVLARSTEPRRAVSIEYSLQVHSAAIGWSLGGGYLCMQMHTFHSHDGFSVDDGHIWMPDGTLLATTRQTRLAG